MKMGQRLGIEGPPLALQIMGLLLGGLVIAQLVTLFLTVLLPPEPQPQYGLDAIARALSGKADGSLERTVRTGPPATTGRGWLTSEHSRHELAMLLGRDDADVQLYFFTPLPFAGTARVPLREVEGGRAAPPLRYASYEQRHPLPPGFMYADYQVAQVEPGITRFPGGGFPGGFPGGGFPGGAVPGSLSPGTITPGRVPVVIVPGGPSTGVILQRTGPGTTGTVVQQLPAPAANSPVVVQGAATGKTILLGSGAAGTATPAAPATGTPVIAVPLRAPLTGRPDIPGGATGALSGLISPGDLPDIASLQTPPEHASPEHIRPHEATPESRIQAKQAPIITFEHRQMASNLPVTAPAPHIDPPPAPAARAVQQPAPVAVAPPPRGLFGFAPAPFVEGDFIAALRLADGMWAVVQPKPEPFPNSWQRRVLLWFLISFALVAPLGWLFARRLVRPIAGFAYAAEQLGRDPTAAILALEGPAEVGRAAHAFNRMQSRLRSFVDDRTAMVGAISHDLRTPLTRLRFRIEDVPDDLRESMLAEVDEMEQMIASVLAFIRDASEPGSRETLDLRRIVEDVVEDAVFVGKPVTLEHGMHAEVEVDPLGIRRLLTNLVENAVKYGGSARIRLFTDHQEAIAEVRDNGPGLPEDELERVFQPFYRAPAARASNKHGTGLGLAVCRSIARAHGGDVRLWRGDQGLVAQVRLPLAYGITTS
ncbi:MAG TPA: ATP-binding protein [Rhizomicrobium sp.]|nr:ATP-binding protein [Rhizomicrobium sp.]